MFVMSSLCTIGRYKNVPVNEINWKVSVGSFTDTCVIKLPLSTSLRKTTSTTTTREPRTVFAVGDKVFVSVGYGVNYSVFEGFVARINYAMPLELECEGYSWQLKNKVFTKSYKSVGLRQMLADLCEGTDIVISEYVPDVEVKAVSFKNAPAIKALEWLQTELLCAVYFDYNTLYAGPSVFAVPKTTQKLRVGWNTADDRELKMAEENTELEINILEKDAAGTVKRTKGESSKYSGVKEVKVRAGLPAQFVETLRKEAQNAQSYRGYEGSITAFLEPHFDKGDVCELEDRLYPDRSGRYFVDTVEGSYGPSGGRQKLTLKHYAN